MATYVRRSKTKARSKHDDQGTRDKQNSRQSENTNPAQDNHDFVNEYRIKELSERRGPHGLDLDGIR
jgi:hypothetical protein